MSPLLIPLVAITLGCGIPIVAILLDYLKTRRIYELYHRERLAAIEKGRELPELPEEFFNSMFNNGRRRERAPRRRSNGLRGGLIWTFIGLAVTAALYQNAGHSEALFGLIPVAIGLSHLIYYAVEGKKNQTAAVAETNPPSCV